MTLPSTHRGVNATHDTQQISLQIHPNRKVGVFSVILLVFPCIICETDFELGFGCFLDIFDTIFLVLYFGFF